MQKKDLAPLPAPVSKSSRGSLSRPLKKMLLNPSGKLLTSVSVQRSAFWCLRTFKTRENDRFFLQENGMIFVVWSSFGPYEQLPSCTDHHQNFRVGFDWTQKQKRTFFSSPVLRTKPIIAKTKFNLTAFEVPRGQLEVQFKRAQPTRSTAASLGGHPA